MPRLEVQGAGLVIETDSDPAIPVAARGVVTQKPVVNLPVRMDPRRFPSTVSQRFRSVAVSPIDRVEEEPLGGGTLDVDAEIIHRHGVFLRRIAPHAES